MAALAGFTHRQITRKLAALGFEYLREAKGSHEIWWNPVTRHRTTIPHHSGDIAEGTLRSILRQADLSPDQFLDA